MEFELSAAGYSFNQQVYFGEFEILLSKIAICYNLMVQDEVQLPNDENGIRDKILRNYLRKDDIRKRIDLTEFLFDREVPEDNSIGRTDIKVQTKNTFEKSEAYYIIECKRLDNKATRGISGLNAEYIKNGIYRFTSNYYSSHYCVNAMIGFVITPMDIHKNTDDINFLLENHFPEANTTTALTNGNFIPDFEYCYRSTHSAINSKQLRLYHLMFNFARNIDYSPRTQ
jgi:hypothetical protein